MGQYPTERESLTSTFAVFYPTMGREDAIITMIVTHSHIVLKSKIFKGELAKDGFLSGGGTMEVHLLEFGSRIYEQGHDVVGVF